MNMLTLAASPEMNQLVNDFEDIAAIIGALIVLVILIEAVTMIPDLIRTIRIHWM